MQEYRHRICVGCCLAVASLLTVACNPNDKPAAESPTSPAAKAPAAKAPADKPTARKPKPMEKTFKVLFETSKGNFTVQVNEDWAPLGARRFHQLVEEGYFQDCRFFRNIPKFMVQFGINGDPAVAAEWRSRTIKDDPARQSNTRGRITYAMAGPNTRTTQFFINFGNNDFLDSKGFSPFGEVIEGMEVVDELNNEYREDPDQGQIQMKGNAYLEKAFPRLDYIKKASFVEAAP